VCARRCESRGGTPSGSTYNTFKCAIVERPTAICVRVSKAANTWKLATGTLPDRQTGATGAGAAIWAPENVPDCSFLCESDNRQHAVEHACMHEGVYMFRLHVRESICRSQLCS
jgi:hypothetical protein